MEKNKGDIRKLLLYEFQLGHNATEAARNINNAKGDGTVLIRTAQNWFLNFRSGNLSTLSPHHGLRGKKFRNINEMRRSLTEFFELKDQAWYRRGIYKLEEQWQKLIESDGEYFDY